MLITVVVCAAAGFQIAAAVLAVRVLRVTGRQPAWLLIAAVAFAMAIRRGVVLYRVLAGDPSFRPDATYEFLALAVSLLMAVGVSRIGPYFLAIRRSEDELRQRTGELADRVRELNCLYAISTVVEEKGSALDEICDEVANLVVRVLRRPELAAAQIVIGEQCFRTGKFTETSWRTAGDICAHGQRLGQIEVCYLENPAADGEEPFRAEEKRLLSAVAERLGRTIERLREAEERRSLQEQLHTAQKMEAIGQLSCGVAHDFDNLITVVLGHVAAARTTLAAKHPACAALDTIAHAADQARGVTKALLRFGGRLLPQKEPLDLCAVVEQTARLLRHSLPASIALAVDLPGQTPVWINADATQIQQILLNLALNARDAMPEGGKLRLAVAVEREVTKGAAPGGAERTQGIARLEVADSGVGMAADVWKRAFEPFFTTKPRGQGTGLGLAIVRAIVEEHGGSVAVASQPGVGSTFTIALPCTEPGAAAPRALAEGATAPGRGELLLVAEDHQLVRELLVSVLQGLEYHVVAVETGPAFLACARQHREDARLLIVDVDLPGRNGRDCLRELRVAGLSVPAIIITARGDEPLDERLDADAVLLQKPFDMRTLGRLVHELLASGGTEEQVP